MRSIFRGTISDHSTGFIFIFFSSRRRHTRCGRDWSSDVCSSDLCRMAPLIRRFAAPSPRQRGEGPALSESATRRSRSARSEERRGGEEGRFGGSPYYKKKKKKEKLSLSCQSFSQVFTSVCIMIRS